MKKRVAHYKRTGVCHAPDHLVNCINKYSDKYEAVLMTELKNLSGLHHQEHRTDVKIQHLVNFADFDIIHFHNRFVQHHKPSLMQYHSPVGDVDRDYRGPKFVLGQYHATLPAYKDICQGIVRNIIDYECPLYKPNYDIDKIRIGFSPTEKFSRGARGWESKGHLETVDILEQVKRKYPQIEYDLMYEIPFDECIVRKSKCNIIIDECVTTSYHRNALEGLALGKLTICSLGDEVQQIFKKLSGSNYIPISNVWLYDLYNFLCFLIEENSVEVINNVGRYNRQWFEKHWNPRTICGEFTNIYDTIIGVKK